MKRISFICVGVQKGATSTLHDILNQHPDLKLPKLKETHFFRDDEKYSKGIKYYFNYYFNNIKGEIIGEIDPEYSYFKQCASRIKQTLGEVKIIFIIRNPVDRAYSHYLMTKRRGLEELSFLDAIYQEKERLRTHYDHIHYSYISRGFYSTQINRYENLFKKSNIRIVLFDDLIKNPKKTINDISSFIGLTTYNYNFDINSNPASEPKNKLIRKFIYQPSVLKKVGGKLIPSKKLKDTIMHILNKRNLKPAKVEKINKDLKRDIYKKYYKDEINKLEENLGLSLEHWRYK